MGPRHLTMDGNAGNGPFSGVPPLRPDTASLTEKPVMSGDGIDDAALRFVASRCVLSISISSLFLHLQ